MTDLPAGPELDRLVAEKVMGWTSDCGVWNCHRQWHASHDILARTTDGWRPSTNIAHAWEVVEAKHPPHFVLQLQWLDSIQLWECHWDFKRCFNGEATISSTAQTAPHAICLAALKAVSA